MALFQDVCALVFSLAQPTSASLCIGGLLLLFQEVCNSLKRKCYVDNLAPGISRQSRFSVDCRGHEDACENERHLGILRDVRRLAWVISWAADCSLNNAGPWSLPHTVLLPLFNIISGTDARGHWFLPASGLPSPSSLASHASPAHPLYHPLAGISSPSFPVLLAAVAGTLTGLTETLLHTPFELLKTRLQSREFQHCRDAHACAQEVWAQGGRVQGGWRRLLAFYQGWEAYLWRQGVWNGVFFTSIAAIRTHAPLALFLPASSAPTTSPRSTASVQCSLSSPSSCPAPPLKLSPLPSPLTSSSSFAFPLVFLSTARVYDFVTGLLAGTVATLLNTPFDVCKTRLQCVTYSRTGGCGGRDGGASLPWVLPYLREICKKEGLRGCFRGLNARLCRAAPGSGILLVAYEGIAKLMRLEEPM